MIVNIGPLPERASSTPGKQRTKTQRAQEVLKKAIGNGTIRDVLWGKDLRHLKDVKKVLPKVLADDDPHMITLEEAALLDNVAIWNKALVARILKTRRLIERQKEEDISMKQQIKEFNDEDEEENEAEEEKATKATTKKSKKKNKKSSSKHADKSKGDKKIKPETKSAAKPSSPTNAIDDTFVMGAPVIKKTRRVSDIIKSVQANVRRKPEAALAKLAEEESGSESSDGSRSGSEGSKSTRDSSHNDNFDAEGGHQVRLF